MNPVFTGKVDFKIYFGTLFDNENVPYTKDLIRTTATKTMEHTGQVVWQTTWLSTVRVNVNDYQEIVGAQYVEVLDVGTTDHGSHFYSVVGYRQLSKKTCELGLAYDPLLSIGIAHITGITGFLKRWTVNDDTAFKYTNTPEPLDRTERLNFTYSRLSVINRSDENPVNPIVGFPYDMTKAPQILEYMNEGNEPTNIYYPELTKTEKPTSFGTLMPLAYAFNDGFTYYPLDTASNMWANYNYAIALGHDLPCNAYVLPDSSIIQFSKSGEQYLNIIGKNTELTPAGIYLYTTGLRNQKAGEMGISLSLYNEVTGDAITVANYELNNTHVTVYCNPYVDGCFMARFSTYAKDINGVTGLVKSSGYQQLTLTSAAKFNGAASLVNQGLSMAELTTDMEISNNSAYTNKDIALNTANTQLAMDTVDITSDLAKTAVNAGLGNIIRDPLGTASNAAGALIDTAANTAKAGLRYDSARYSANRTYENIINNNNIRYAQKAAAIKTQGSLSRVVPPSTKYARANLFCISAFDFVVRLNDISQHDKKRLDNFFTAYGYNVDDTVLNDVDQLSCRSKFTYVMADTVQITSVSGGTDLTRLHDSATMSYIATRFANGLRIWKEKPNYDWATINNPIV